MKMHLAWIRVTAAAATTIATFGGPWAAAQSQFGPYASAPQYSTQYSNIAPYGVQPTQPAGYPATTSYPATTYPTTTQDRYSTASAQQPNYAPAQQPIHVPATQSRYSPAVRTTQTQPQYQAPQYQQPRYEQPRYQPPAARPTYPSLAQQPKSTIMPGTSAVSPQHVENLPTPDSAISGDAMPHGYNTSSPYPTTAGTEGYFASDPGCTTGNCGYTGCEPCMEECDAGCRWFCGVYGLYMTRDGNDFQRLAINIDDNTTTYPYYPPANVTALTTDVDYDWQPGYEIRFGALFDVGGSACDYGDCGAGYGDCNTGCGSYCPPQTYAWEAAYWWLEDDTQWNVVRDDMPDDNFRIYGMKNFAGIEYDRDQDDLNWRPVNDYYDYQLPVQDPVPPVAGDIRVVAQRVRTNWSAQNMELNFLRLPMFCGGSCGDYGCNTECGDCGGCGPTCAPPFTMVGLCGLRYLRVDDAFEFGSWYTEYDGAAWGAIDALYYDINTDNHLVGFQLGANMNYCVACRWNVFWDTNFGVYNNYIESYQRVYGGGDVRFIGTQGNAAVYSHKNDVAFLGEMRLGGAYDFTCNWRGVLAYRAIGISGVALSTDQIPTDFSNSAQVGLIDSAGSMVIHGVQAGVECRY